MTPALKLAIELVEQWSDDIDYTGMNRDEQIGYMVCILYGNRSSHSDLTIPKAVTTVREAFDEIDKAKLEAERELVLTAVRSVCQLPITAEIAFSHDCVWQLVVTIYVGRNAKPTDTVKLHGICHDAICNAGVTIHPIIHVSFEDNHE